MHDDFDRYKYTFLGWLNAFQLARSVSDSAHGILVVQLHMKNCVIMSEDAAWTASLDEAYLEFPPKTGLVGTPGRIMFYGRNDQWTHALQYGPGLIFGVVI